MKRVMPPVVCHRSGLLKGDSHERHWGAVKSADVTSSTSVRVYLFSYPGPCSMDIIGQKGKTLAAIALVNGWVILASYLGHFKGCEGLVNSQTQMSFPLSQLGVGTITYLLYISLKALNSLV